MEIYYDYCRELACHWNWRTEFSWGPHRLFGSRHTLWQTWYIYERDKHDLLTATHYKFEWIQGVPWYLQRFRWFLPSFARLAEPLSCKLEIETFPLWKSELEIQILALKTLQHLQHRLLSPPILALPRLNGHCTLDTDACDKRIGCI